MPPPPTTLAIDYSVPPPGAAIETLGLRIAVDEFLRALFRHGAQEKFICRPADLFAFAQFRELAKQSGLDPEEKCVGLDPRTPKYNLEPITCLFRPDPDIAPLVWRRRQLAAPAYAACGLVHSVAGDQATKAVADLCLAPTTSSDALICPSRAIQSAVHKIWDIYADYLAHRFGGTYKSPIQTPVIPIGIDTEKFAAKAAPENRKQQRQLLNIADDEIAILFVGRLSFVTKAHPLPLFLAVEEAAKKTDKKLRLILYGYFTPKDMQDRFIALAREFLKQTRYDIITNDDPRFPDGLWAAADIFTSLVDNVQESFGLTPIEAMACGLPAVVTDWDGYRDGIRHEQDGFLIPTLAPPPEAGHALANHFFNENNYGVYLAAAAQSTAIDIAAAAEAFAALANDPAKRAAMGQSGNTRAQNTYDWKVIIPAYEALWSELSARNKAAAHGPATPASWPAAHPHFPNPYEVFASFPSASLSPDDRLRIVMTSEEISTMMKHDMNLFVPELLPPAAFMRELTEAIRRAGSVRIGDILVNADDTGKPLLWRCFGWMLKHGIAVRVTA